MTPYLTPEEIIRFIAVDECSVRLETRMRKVVTKKGSKPVVTSEKSYSKGVSIIGGVTGTGQIIWDIIDTRMNSTHFMKFLDIVKSEYGQYLPGEGDLRIQLDNATFHKTKKVKEKAGELNIELIYQPSHSPHVMAAEEIWRQLREFLRSRVFKSVDFLRDVITEFFLTNRTLNISIANYLGVREEMSTS